MYTNEDGSWSTSPGDLLKITDHNANGHGVHMYRVSDFIKGYALHNLPNWTVFHATFGTQITWNPVGTGSSGEVYEYEREALLKALFGDSGIQRVGHSALLRGAARSLRARVISGLPTGGAPAYRSAVCAEVCYLCNAGIYAPSYWSGPSSNLRKALRYDPNLNALIADLIRVFSFIKPTDRMFPCALAVRDIICEHVEHNCAEPKLNAALLLRTCDMVQALPEVIPRDGERGLLRADHIELINTFWKEYM